jgi:hypothetical protein
MAQILANPEMAQQLACAEGPIPVVDEHGTLIGVCTPVRYPHSPYTREELEAARRQYRDHPESGKTLAEVMAHLRQLDAKHS